MDAKKVSTGLWCTNSHQFSDAAVPAPGWARQTCISTNNLVRFRRPLAVQCFRLVGCLSLYRLTCGADDPVSKSPTAASPPLLERHSRPAAN